MSMKILGIPVTDKAKVEVMLTDYKKVLDAARNGKYDSGKVAHAIELTGELARTLDGDPDYRSYKVEAEQLHAQLCDAAGKKA